MIVTFDIGARFSFLWRVLYLLLLFLVNICRTAKTVEEGEGGGEASTQRGCSPLMVLVACWFMGLFEL